MNDSSTGGLPASPPPPPIGTTRVPTGPRQRPWWGPVDVLIAVPVIFLVSTVGALIAGAIANARGEWTFDGATELPVYGLFIAVLFQQAAQGLWPVAVSRHKGLGLARDWWFRFDLPRDVGLGVGLAMVCVLGTGAVTEVVARLVALPPDEDPSNTAIISDNQGSPWLIAVILVVVIGAPLSEELLFRGLVQRAFNKVLGPYVAIIGSTILFALPHFQPGSTWREAVVLLAGIAFIGLVLAIAVERYRRLGPAIIAHFLFNLFGTVVTLVT